MCVCHTPTHKATGSPQHCTGSLQSAALLISVHLVRHHSSTPVLHNPLQLKVYTPANFTFIFHSLDCLLHAFIHATLSTGQALSLLHVCGNPTKPVERHLSKITMNIYSRGPDCLGLQLALSFMSCMALEKFLNLSLP